MFEDDELTGLEQFTSDFLSSLYCRIFIPGSDIVQKGEKVSELYLIYKGTVNMALDSVQGDASVFFILPTHSYFGDFQLILNIRSQFVYK
jgi:signal-transduction protein with cAMP-binding, CBS, and nucleotidyltransferase domain